MNYCEVIYEIKKLLMDNKISYEKWIQIKEEIDDIFNEQFKQTSLILRNYDPDSSQD